MEEVNKNESIFVYLFDERETARLDEVLRRLFEQAENIIRAEAQGPTV